MYTGTGIQWNDVFRVEFWVTCFSIVVRGRRVKLKGNARKSAQSFPISWLPIFDFNFLFHPIFLQVILSKTFQLSAIEVFWILSFLYCSERRPICKFIGFESVMRLTRVNITKLVHYSGVIDQLSWGSQNVRKVVVFWDFASRKYLSQEPKIFLNQILGSMIYQRTCDSSQIL